MGRRLFLSATFVGLTVVAFALGCSSRGNDDGGPPANLTAPGESPEEAAVRLFPAAYKSHMESTAYPDILAGATPGSPQPYSREYVHPGPTLASWAVPDAATAVQFGLFDAMKPLAMSDSAYLVPMLKDGRAVDEFDIYTESSGHWATEYGPMDPLPGGQIHALEEATAKLHTELGEGAEVRRAVLLPSGLIMAVGKSGEREAAIYLDFVNDGPGIDGTYSGYLPLPGTLFTPDELAALLTSPGSRSEAGG